ncbi:MAG TPA: hypothetical protein VHZ31_03995 [Solirubrobacteraceae bacterium]|nr:hypothetical protein [Solirubrobacteraceae bacterium]
MVEDSEHSKKRVKRAGKLLRDLRVASRDGAKSAFEAFDADEVRQAIDVVEWWRTPGVG